MYKLALKTSLYDFTSARDFYREITAAAGVEMHRHLVLRYIELQALLLTPIAPHWAEYIWLEVLKKVCIPPAHTGAILTSFCPRRSKMNSSLRSRPPTSP